MYNPDFNSPEFEGIKNEAGLNRFILSVKQWVERTNSIGIVARAGRYGGTYAHKDIAFEFASWVSPPPTLRCIYLILLNLILFHIFCLRHHQVLEECSHFH